MTLVALFFIELRDQAALLYTALITLKLICGSMLPRRSLPYLPQVQGAGSRMKLTPSQNSTGIFKLQKPIHQGLLQSVTVKVPV